MDETFPVGLRLYKKRDVCLKCSPEIPGNPPGRVYASGALARPHRADCMCRGLLPHRISDRTARPHRICAPVRTHDVPGLKEPGKDGIHQARPGERRNLEWLDAL